MLVVTLPPSAQKNPRAFALKAKKEGAQVLEIRGDLTPHVKPFDSALPILRSPRGEPIGSFRPTFVDLERSELSRHRRALGRAKLILSFHHYEKTPTFFRLKGIVLRLRREKPWAVKIATMVRTPTDLVTLDKLQRWMKRQKIRSIVLGMGPLAHLSRITSPLRNILTYTVLDGTDASAPGQLPLSVYHLIADIREPSLFGILGGPHITASLSPLIHNTLFARHGIDALYSSFPVEHFAPAMKALKELGIDGLSVTAPFKRDAYETADHPEPVCMTLGVANTLVRRGRSWKAFNTDWYGILHGYPELKTAKRIVILGAGGAVPSAILASREANPEASITVYARDPEKAAESLAVFGVDVRKLSASRMEKADVVICAVSADVTLSFPNPSGPKAVAIDLRYGKPTRFLVAAAKAGYRTKDGIPMLIHQALRQFRKFTGETPDPSDAPYLTRLLSSYLHGQ